MRPRFFTYILVQSVSMIFQMVTLSAAPSNLIKAFLRRGTLADFLDDGATAGAVPM